MANTVTLYKFQIELSDIDRGVYESLQFRVAMHPSETNDFLLTRVLAYALNFCEGLEFSPGGLSDNETPAIRQISATGQTLLNIEVGTPSAKRLHKSSKASQSTKVYTYKDPRNLIREAKSERVHRLEEIEFYAFSPQFLESLAGHLERDNRWTLVHNEGALTISSDSFTEQGEAKRLSTQDEN